MFFKKFWQQEKPLKVAKEPQKLTHEDMQVIQQRLITTTHAIYKATHELNIALRRPVTAVEIAGYMGIDSAKVTPRMPRMVKKELVKVEHWGQLSDRRWRKYYTAIVKED